MARLYSFTDHAAKQAEFSLLMANLPGRPPQTIGVLLLDASSDQLHLRLRQDWEAVASEEDGEVLAELADDLVLQSRERGGLAVLEWLEGSASQTIRVSDREAVTVRDFNRTLTDLYREHVPTMVRPFKTHLPRYSLAVAAGPFLTNSEDISELEWMETPLDLVLDDEMFIAQIRGKSMEPRIPDESFCVFRKGVVGSRNGRLVLVRNSELADDNQYTVKRYRSFKQVTEDGFTQTRIRLESLNPAFPSWDLDFDDSKYEIIAEFVRVLD